MCVQVLSLRPRNTSGYWKIVDFGGKMGVVRRERVKPKQESNLPIMTRATSRAETRDLGRHSPGEDVDIAVLDGGVRAI